MRGVGVTKSSAPRAAVARVSFIVGLALAMAACQLVVDTSGLSGGATGGSPAADASAPESGGTDGGSAEAGPLDSGSLDGDAADGSVTAPTLVRSTLHPESNVTSFSMPLGSSPVTGHTLLLVVGATDNEPSAVTGGGVTWSLLAQATSHIAVSVWSAGVVAGAGGSVTVDFPVTQLTTLGTLTEWADLGSLDTFVLADGISTTVATGPIPATPGELVLAAAGLHNFATGMPTSSFSGLGSVAADDERLLVAYDTPSSPGSLGTSWSASTSDGWDTVLLTFHHR